jgi:hypothetical protein
MFFAVQDFLFYNSISAEELESYDELEKKEKLKNIKKIKRKFQLFDPLNKLHNIIIDIRDFINRTAEFLILVTRMIPFDSRTK